MADNSTMGGSTDVIRDKDRAGVKTQVFGLDVGIGTGTEALMSATNPAPVTNKVTPLTLATGTITTSASTVTATTDIPNAGSVTVVVAGTYAGVNFIFEASLDGTTWVTVVGQRVDGFITEGQSGVLPANQTRGWSIPMPGFLQFRVRATAYTSGTANISIGPSADAFETSPTVGSAGVPTATESGVSASASSVTLLASNTARRGPVSIQNDATSSTLYVRLSSSAASNASGGYSVVMPAGSHYETSANYTGAITGIWASAVGFANVTELT